MCPNVWTTFSYKENLHENLHTLIFTQFVAELCVLRTFGGLDFSLILSARNLS
eukprot:COSAG02_NODE_16584_length_1073_cov_0.746407_1_plen_52_part_10